MQPLEIAALSLLVALAVTPARAGDAFRLVTFDASDGGRIQGNLYGSGAHAVVLAHGAVFNKESWDAQARELVAKGLQVLAIDFRGYGESKAGSEGKKLELDVLGAIAYLKQHGAEKASVVGASMGGGASGRAATLAKEGEIYRLVLLAAVPVDNPEKLTGEKLFIVSEGDRMAESTRDRHERAVGKKKLVILPGDAHAQHIFKTDQAGPLMENITQWLLEGR